MPVGPFATFGDCVAAQRRKGRSEESARRICGFIEAQTRKHGMKKFEISKIDEEQHQVFGWANISMRVDGELIEDRQGDIIEPQELEKAAYQFVLDFRESGVMHKGRANGRLIESTVFTPEKLAAMGLAKDALPIGWWIGFQIDDDEVFKRVKKGELTMFSIQGSAQREAA